MNNFHINYEHFMNFQVFFSFNNRIFITGNLPEAEFISIRRIKAVRKGNRETIQPTILQDWGIMI